MSRVKIQSLALVLVLFAAISGSAAPSNATPKENMIQQIWKRIVGVPQPPRGSRGDVCEVTPMSGKVIWNDRPIFAWQGEVSQVKLYQEKDLKKAIWFGAVKPDQTSIAYNGKPLSPGKYIWKAMSKGDAKPLAFEVMGGDNRVLVNQKLQQMKQGDLSTQEVRTSAALSRMEFWSQNGLVSDAAIEMYAMAGSDPDIEAMRKEFVQETCKMSQP